MAPVSGRPRCCTVPHVYSISSGKKDSQVIYPSSFGNELYFCSAQGAGRSAGAVLFYWNADELPAVWAVPALKPFHGILQVSSRPALSGPVIGHALPGSDDDPFLPEPVEPYARFASGASQPVAHAAAEFSFNEKETAERACDISVLEHLRSSPSFMPASARRARLASAP